MANEKRLIDANALYTKLGKMAREPYYQHDGDDYYVGIADASMEVHCAPTVDAVEVVHGHKVVRECHRGVARYIPCPCCGSAVPGNKPYTEKIEYCSVCGKKLDGTFQNYCPNCGAKMRGSEV